jgi:AraC-like DNA-binding protein
VHIKNNDHSKADEKFLELLNDAILANIDDADLDVNKLAKIMNMSRITLYRKIKAASVLTPIELINITRLKKAAELLAEGQYKIYEISYMVGFSSQSNFSRNFQKHFNLTPRDYATSKTSEKNKE